MWPQRSSLLQALSDSESLSTRSTPSSYSISKVQTMMKVSISETNKGVKPQKEFLSKIVDNTKPSRLGKSCSELKNCDVNNVLQTLKRFDEKYCRKPVKEQNIIPIRTDVLLPAFHTNNKSSSSNVNSSIKYSDKNINSHTELAKAKKETEPETGQDNSDVSELSDSNVSSVGSHRLFKQMPYKILTFEDLIAAQEVQNLVDETNSDIQSGIKDLREKEVMSAKEGSIINDTRKVIHSEGKQNSVLESEDEISEVIEEEIEAESIGSLTEDNSTSINDSSFRTNSSYERIMNQLSDHSANQDVEKHIFSKEQNVSSGQCDISDRSLSLLLMSIKYKEEASDNDIAHSSSVKSESRDNIPSTVHGSGCPLTEETSNPLDSQEFRFLRSNSNKTDMKPLKNREYCSIGVQTESDMIYHPISHATIETEHSSSSQPVMHSNTGESRSLQEIIPVYRYYSRTMEFPGKGTPVDLAFSEIIKHQIELTKHFINSQQRMYQAYCTSVENMSANYKPVTLEDTKQFIHNHFKYRHRLREELNQVNAFGGRVSETPIEI
ncbi:hypothetical protein B7P43_G07343 [Cryptotermes secundus]|uniref:DUF4614 domain-containing protein n=2 Tax=Cryptotermes secundus TaxID=105785 RepID=A0A2J7PMY8_9NEOP|nr:uncharacterized protein LOC111872925 isoform X2 [Cryptotermes secundus]PNF17703.1 hypothetical protein B7P43_G07343 [Cryptotermes secundus]